MSLSQDTLKKMRGSPAQFDSQGLQNPVFDPISIIASLIAPGILSSLTRSAAPMAEEAAQPAFSQADSLLARLRANQPKIAAGMEKERLPQFLKDRFQNIELPRAPSPVDSSKAFPLQAPALNDPLSWISHPGLDEGARRFYPDWLRQVSTLMRHQGGN